MGIVPALGQTTLTLAPNVRQRLPLVDGVRTVFCLVQVAPVVFGAEDVETAGAAKGVEVPVSGPVLMKVADKNVDIYVVSAVAAEVLVLQYGGK